MRWSPQGKGKMGHPRNSWRRGEESEIRKWGHTWSTRERLAQDRS